MSSGRWRDRSRQLVAEFSQPAATGLPRWPAVCWFPLLLLAVLVVLVTLGLSGSSTGMFWSMFASGEDPNLLAGTPRPARSDEWLTFVPWLISQASQGFPAVNTVYPGGMDTTVLLDLPAWDWVTLFRPHVVGFLFLGLGQGLALRWWLPAFVMTAACYWLMIGLLPRRPLVCATLSTAFLFCPLLQWWFAPSAFYPPAFCFLAVAAVLFALRDSRLWVRALWAAATGYVAICMFLTLYVAFIIPVVLVAAAVCAGLLFTESARDGNLRCALRRLLPLPIAAGASGGVLLLFAVTRSSTISAITRTVYPGTRLDPTGAIGLDGLLQILSAPFGQRLIGNGIYSGALGPNQSEAATPVLIGLFLLVPLGWFVVRDWRTDGRRQWAMVACIAVTVVFLAYLFVPSWDPIAHLLLLDRIPANRLRLGLGVLSMIAIGLLAWRLAQGEVRVPWPITWITTGLAAVSFFAVAAWLAAAGDTEAGGSLRDLVVGVLVVLSVTFFTRGKTMLGAGFFLIASLILSIGVNPVYRGIFDLRQTAAGQAIESANGRAPGTWVGIGNRQLSALLFETGANSFNGVQLYPSAQMWQDIDPTGAQEQQWNRYASLVWTPGPGEPQLSNPETDVIAATFDSCSTFAKENVTYVVADQPVDQSCLTEFGRQTQGGSTVYLYRIVR